MNQRTEDPSVSEPRAAEERDGGSTTVAAGPLLPDQDVAAFRAGWQEIQIRFVDEPQVAVEEADGLVAELMRQLAGMFAEERSRLEREWGRGAEVSTEELRQALQHYRSFFDRLLST